MKDHLDMNQNNLAMVICITPKGGHSVVVAKNNENGDYVFRDVFSGLFMEKL